MSDKHPIRNSIIASVAAGIILGALGLVWPPAKGVLGWIWTALGTAVTVPIWVFLVGVGAVVGIAMVLRRSRAFDRAALEPEARPSVPTFVIQPIQTGQPTYVRSESEAADDVIEVSRLEIDLLKRVAKEDDAPIYMDTLKRSLGITNIRLQTVLDRLIELDLIDFEGEEYEEQAVFLTAKGRQFVLEKRLAR